MRVEVGTLLGVATPEGAAFGYGVRPMNASSLVWMSASSGMSTRGPKWPLWRIASSTGTMRTMGSLTLCRSLLMAGLVDRFRVVVFPVITGSTGADRIYDGYPDVALEMINSRTFDGRIQLLEYVPTVLAGPPGREKADH